MKLKHIALLISFLGFTNTAYSFERRAGFWSDPIDESNTGLFNQLTPVKSQRENWYNVSPYIAEFWCTISNAGFIYVGLKHRSPEIFFVGLASIISHTVPKNWLLLIDKFGVVLALSKAVREYDTIRKNPDLIKYFVMAGIILASDTYLARNENQTWPHIIWHLSSAFFANKFLNKLKK